MAVARQISAAREQKVKMNCILSNNIPFIKRAPTKNRERGGGGVRISNRKIKVLLQTFVRLLDCRIFIRHFSHKNNSFFII